MSKDHYQKHSNLQEFHEDLSSLLLGISTVQILNTSETKNQNPKQIIKRRRRRWDCKNLTLGIKGQWERSLKANDQEDKAREMESTTHYKFFFYTTNTILKIFPKLQTKIQKTHFPETKKTNFLFYINQTNKKKRRKFYFSIILQCTESRKISDIRVLHHFPGLKISFHKTLFITVFISGISKLVMFLIPEKMQSKPKI